MLDKHNRGLHLICFSMPEEEISVIATTATSDLCPPKVDDIASVDAMNTVDHHCFVSELDSAPRFFFGRSRQLLEFQAVTAEESFVLNKWLFPKHIGVWLKLGLRWIDFRQRRRGQQERQEQQEAFHVVSVASPS